MSDLKINTLMVILSEWSKAMFNLVKKTWNINTMCSADVRRTLGSRPMGRQGVQASEEVVSQNLRR